MPYKKLAILSWFVFLSLIARSAHAVCPVCTVAVGAGLGLAEWLGIDDFISGLWIGALAVSVSIWTINWLEKRGIRFRGTTLFVFLGYYLVIVGPLWYQGFIGQNPQNQLCGIDKLLFGIILGSLLFAAGIVMHNQLRKKNGNRSYFKGQKIAFSLLPVIIGSIILYLTC